jgi:hypothetical protein
VVPIERPLQPTPEDIMKDDREANAWIRHTRHDTLFNGALIAAGILGLLVAMLGGPQMLILGGLVLSEAALA